MSSFFSHVMRYPDLTVCIPVKNEEHTLGRCLDSIINNGYGGNLNVLIGVNGSTDNTLLVAKCYAEEDRRIQVYTSSPGKARAWNVLFDAAQTDMVCFVDGDVRMKEGSLSALARILTDTDAVAVAASLKKDILHLDLLEKGLSFPLNRYPSDQLSGACYGVKKNALRERLHEKGYEQMPATIIHDDLFLTLICEDRRLDGSRHKQHWVGTSDVVAIYKERTLQDEFLYFRRRHLGNVQITRDHPNLHYLPFDIKNKKNILHRYYAHWINLHSFSDLLISPFSVMTRRAITYLKTSRIRKELNAFLSTAEYEQGWEPLPSTKLL